MDISLQNWCRYSRKRAKCCQMFDNTLAQHVDNNLATSANVGKCWQILSMMTSMSTVLCLQKNEHEQSSLVDGVGQHKRDQTVAAVFCAASVHAPHHGARNLMKVFLPSSELLKLPGLSSTAFLRSLWAPARPHQTVAKLLCQNVSNLWPVFGRIGTNFWT